MNKTSFKKIQTNAILKQNNNEREQNTAKTENTKLLRNKTWLVKTTQKKSQD